MRKDITSPYPKNSQEYLAYNLGWYDAEDATKPMIFHYERKGFQTAYDEGYAAYVQMEGRKQWTSS